MFEFKYKLVSLSNSFNTYIYEFSKFLPFVPLPLSNSPPLTNPILTDIRTHKRFLDLVSDELSFVLQVSFILFLHY